jgi:hypothetical protein
VESISKHNKGSIVRTFTGDFHVVTESRRDLMKALDRRQGYSSWEDTERSLLETRLRELTARVDELEED